MGVKRLLLFGFVLFAVIVGYVFFFGNSSKAVMHPSEAEGLPLIDDVSDCLGRSDATVCIEDRMQLLLKGHTGSELMSAFADRFSTTQCHQFGHVLGRTIYKQYRDTETALATCSRECASSCIHGIIGEAFMQEVGLDESEVDSEHLNPEDIRKFGKRLCTSLSSCHGVGHALLQTYRNFSDALSMCNDIAAGVERTMCYRGIFMEFADSTVSTGLRDGDFDMVVDPSDPRSMCSLGDTEVHRACLRYFPRVSIALALIADPDRSREQSFAGAAAACTSLQSADRQACIAGIGTKYASFAFSEPAILSEMCTSFDDTFDRKSCVLGSISSAVEYNRSPELLLFCASLSDRELSGSCYHNAFYATHFLKRSVPDLRALCRDDRCEAQAKNYSRSPWIGDGEGL